MPWQIATGAPIRGLASAPFHTVLCSFVPIVLTGGGIIARVVLLVAVLIAASCECTGRANVCSQCSSGPRPCNGPYLLREHGW